MAQFLHTPVAELILWLAVCAILVAVGVYVVSKVRNQGNEAPSTSDLISNFRELYSRGDLSDEEYRNIKTKLNRRLQTDLKEEKEETS